MGYFGRSVVTKSVIPSTANKKGSVVLYDTLARFTADFERIATG